jgi:hypothetical protein
MQMVIIVLVRVSTALVREIVGNVFLGTVL